MMSIRIGVDIGGTKIEALALDAAGREVVRKRIPTPRGDYEATVAAAVPLVACYCGRFGCIETYLSGPGLARDHQQVTGARLAPDEIVSLQGESLRRYEERLARALATVINLLDPDVIVLGGGMSNIERLYGEVPRLWRRHVFSDRVTTRLARHAHGDSSGARRAAWLWPSTR